MNTDDIKDIVIFEGTYDKLEKSIYMLSVCISFGISVFVLWYFYARAEIANYVSSDLGMVMVFYTFGSSTIFLYVILRWILRKTHNNLTFIEFTHDKVIFSREGFLHKREKSIATDEVDKFVVRWPDHNNENAIIEIHYRNKCLKAHVKANREIVELTEITKEKDIVLEEIY